MNKPNICFIYYAYSVKKQKQKYEFNITVFLPRPLKATLNPLFLSENGGLINSDNHFQTTA